MVLSSSTTVGPQLCVAIAAGHCATLDRPLCAGLLLATGGDDNLVKVWRADREQALHTLEGHTREVSCVRWSPSGAGSHQHTLISTSYDNTARYIVTICSWDCAPWWPFPSSQLEDVVCSMRLLLVLCWLVEGAYYTCSSSLEGK